jgi:predicted S18 family serine protease
MHVRKPLVALLLVSVAFALLLGYALQSYIEERVALAASNVSLPQEGPLIPRAVPGTTVTRVRMALPAVDRYDNGVLGLLEVEAASPGRGAVYVRVDEKTPLINPETQASLRTSIDVAKQIAGGNASQLDIYYSITSDSEIVGGRSAGAAMSVSTLSLLTGSKLRGDTAITGTVEADGSVGPVGKIVPKARAAKAAGFTVFLVPPGESVQRIPKEYCREEVIGNAIFRNCRVVVEESNVSAEVGLSVVEVGTVLEAFNRMKAA